MRTRQRSYDAEMCNARRSTKRQRRSHLQQQQQQGEEVCEPCPLDQLPDDLLVSIMAAVSSSAERPADLMSAALTCRRWAAAALEAAVLAVASPAALGVRAAAWSLGAHRFLRRCAEAGSAEAAHILGAIRFYCLGNRGGGESLMAKAGMAGHAASLHWLAVIQFNGSGGGRRDKDLQAGVALCARAAALGHVDAMRELGHCLQDGYGVARNIARGRALLLDANAREAAAALPLSTSPATPASALACLHHHLHFICAAKLKLAQAQAQQQLNQNQTQQQADPNPNQNPSPNQNQAQTQQQHISPCRVMRLLQQGGGGCSLLSDFGCNVPVRELPVANRFLVEWFTERAPGPGLRLCSHAHCGRPETRRHEFRRCSACGRVNYCSRACQALDWKIRHKFDCSPALDWEEHHHQGVGGEQEQEEDDVEDIDMDQQQIESQQQHTEMEE